MLVNLYEAQLIEINHLNDLNALKRHRVFSSLRLTARLLVPLPPLLRCEAQGSRLETGRAIRANCGENGFGCGGGLWRLPMRLYIV